LRGRAMIAALFKTQVVVCTDAGECRQLLTTQAGTRRRPKLAKPTSLGRTNSRRARKY
jgi:hypothetical protein